MATTLKSHQIDVGAKKGQIPVVSDALRIPVKALALATSAIPLPSGVDPTYCIAHLSIIDPGTTAAEDTHNMWVESSGKVIIARNATSIILVNTTTTDIDCLVVIR